MENRDFVAIAKLGLYGALGFGWLVWRRLRNAARFEQKLDKNANDRDSVEGFDPNAVFSKSQPQLGTINWSQVVNRMISSGIATDEQIIGCKPSQVKSLASKHPNLSADYLDFLRVMGISNGKLFDDCEISYPFLGRSSKLLSDFFSYSKNENLLSEDDFVIGHRRQETIFFFRGGDDDAVYAYYCEDQDAMRCAVTFERFLISNLASMQDTLAHLRDSGW